MIDDLINDFMILDKGDNRHAAPTLWADKRVYFIDLFFIIIFIYISLLVRNSPNYTLTNGLAIT
jgi:hypothetical protein